MDLYHSSEILYSRVLETLETKSTARAMDELYDTVDNWMLDNTFDEVEDFCRFVTENSFPLVLLVGLLTITSPYRKRLGDSRIGLADFTFNLAVEIHGTDKAEEILKGLM